MRKRPCLRKVQHGAVLGSWHRSGLGQGCLHHPPVTTAGDDEILLAGLCDMYLGGGLGRCCQRDIIEAFHIFMGQDGR